MKQHYNRLYLVHESLKVILSPSSSSREETRPFNVVADDPNGVTCLVLDRQSYREMIADELSRLKRDETVRYARKK